LFEEHQRLEEEGQQFRKQIRHLIISCENIISTDEIRQRMDNINIEDLDQKILQLASEVEDKISFTL
jgi:hypothetical protein